MAREYISVREMSERLRTAVDKFNHNGDWEKVLDAVFDYSHQEYDIGYDYGKSQASK